MKPVLLHPDAEAGLEAGVAFYESRRAGLGLAFQDEVESVLWSVRADPQRWPPHRETELRRCLLKRFPYFVFY